MRSGRTVGGDKRCDLEGFVATVRTFRLRRHVAPKKMGSTIDARTTRHQDGTIRHGNGSWSNRSSSG